MEKSLATYIKNKSEECLTQKGFLLEKGDKEKKQSIKNEMMVFLKFCQKGSYPKIVPLIIQVFF